MGQSRRPPRTTRRLVRSSTRVLGGEGSGRRFDGGVRRHCEELRSSRIDANPPGRYGVVALVVDVGQVRADAGFSSSFVQGGQTLGARAAVAGATMMPDESEDSSSILSSLLDGFGSDAGAAVGAARIVLGRWSALLRAFSDGQEALGEAVRSALDQLAPGEFERAGFLGGGSHARRDGKRRASARRARHPQARARQHRACRGVRGRFVFRLVLRGESARCRSPRLQRICSRLWLTAWKRRLFPGRKARGRCRGSAYRVSRRGSVDTDNACSSIGRRGCCRRVSR